MRLTSLVRRSVAVTAATALLSGGLAGFLAPPAFAAGTITSFSPTSWDNRSTVRMQIDGSGFPVPINPDFGVSVIFTPLVVDNPNEVAPFSVEADPGNTSTRVFVDVPLAMAPPGQYNVQVAEHDGANPSAAAATTFLVYAYGGANATGVGQGTNPSGNQIECTLLISCLSRALPGTTPLDISGSNIAIGAKVRFLKADNTPDAGLRFVQHNPNNSENNLDTQDADSVDGTGYASSTLLQGNYTANPDVLGLPGFTPGLHKLQILNTDGDATGATVDFAQPWFSPTALSPSGTGPGAKNVVVTLTGQGIRSGSSLFIASGATSSLTSSCAGVTVGASTVSAPDAAHPGTFTKISAPVSMADCATDNFDARAVTVIGPDGARFSRNALFNIVPNPTFTALEAAYDELGQGARVGFGAGDVNITGTNFQGVGSVVPAEMTQFSFGEGITVTTIAVTSANNAKVSIDVSPDAPVGDKVATVTNPDGGSSTKSGDYLESGDPDPLGDPAPLIINPGPKVTKVEPSSLKQSTNTPVVITGTFTAADSYLVQVCDHLGTQDCTPSTNINVGAVTDSATTLSFSVSTTTPVAGIRDVLVTDLTDKGRFYCTGCMSVDTLSVSPVSVPNTADAALTFTASGIETVTNASTATLTRLVPFTGQGPISLKAGTFLTPGGANTASGTFSLSGVIPGKYSILVTKDPGAPSPTTWTCSGCLTITGLPITTTEIDRVPTDGTAPATSTSGGQGATDLLIKVVGTNFATGMQVSIPDVIVHDLTIVSPTELRFKADIPLASAPGTKPVTVTSADGSASGGSALTFEVTAAPVPSTATTPAALGQGAGTAGFLSANPGMTVSISIQGEGFLSGAQLSLGPLVDVTDETVTQGKADECDPLPLPGCEATPDTLTAKVAVAEDATPGKRDAVVTNPDSGSGTRAESFTVNQGPKVTSVANAAGFPILAPDGVAHPITILGSGFVTGTTPSKLAVIPADGVTITNVVVVDVGKITADIKVDTTAALGARTVGVTNDGDKGYGSLTPVYVAKVPSAPRSLKLLGGPSSLKASWVAPLSTNGAPVTQYRLTLRRVGTTVVIPATVSGTTLTHTFTSVANGVSYAVGVSAVNAAGAGAVTAATGIPGLLTTITNVPSTKLSAFGSAVTFTGRLMRGPTPVVSRIVDLRFTPSVGSAFTRRAVTSSTGAWSYRFVPTYTFSMRASFSGDNVYRSSASASVPIGVRARVTRTAPASGSTTSASSVLKIAGVVAPNKRGKYVYLYRYLNGRKSLVSRTVLTSSSTFVFTGTPRRGTYTFRVYIGNTTGNLAAYSSSFVIKRV